MADPTSEDTKVEEKPTQPTATPTPSETTTQPDDPRLARMEATINELGAALKATLNPPPRATDADGLPSWVVDSCKRRGMSDAEIKQNAPLILPFIEGATAQVLPILGGLSDELNIIKAERNTRDFPFWNTELAKGKSISDEVVRLRKDAADSGRYMDVTTAYHTAVALNVDKINSEQRAVDTAVSHRSAAATASGSASSVRKAAYEPPTPPQSKADLDAMTREERLKFYEESSNLPIL